MKSGDLALLIDGKDTLSINPQSTANRLQIERGAIEERLGSDWAAIGVSDRKRQIIDFFALKKELTSSQLAEYTGLTQGRVRKILKELAADGLIEKIGDYRYAVYIVKNEIKL